MSTPSAPAASTASASERQVLVVGGSVEGLAAAAFLRRVGHSPVVVTAGERRLERGDVVLWSTAVSLLSSLGAAEELLTSATAVREWHLRLPTGETDRLSGAHGDDWPFVAVGRDRLRRLLRERLSPGDLRLSKTPTRLEPDDSGVFVEFADGVRERFDVVVGGDRARSWVRQSRFDSNGPTPWGTTTWTVRSPCPLGTAGTVSELWRADRAVACGPRRTSDRAQVVTAGGGSDPDAAVRHLASLSDAGPFDAVPPSELTVVDGGPDYRVQSERWTTGRVALLGPAARPLPPTLSLAPSLSVEDASVLADELASPVSSTAALRRYARRRRERHRTLDRLVSTTAPSPHDCLAPDGTDLHGLHRVRAAILHAFFARRASTVSGDDSTPC